MLCLLISYWDWKWVNYMKTSSIKLSALAFLPPILKSFTINFWSKKTIFIDLILCCITGCSLYYDMYMLTVAIWRPHFHSSMCSLFCHITFYLLISYESLLYTYLDCSFEVNLSVLLIFCYLLHRLWTRKEKEIAIVTHRGFLNHTLNAFGNDCHPFVKKEICKQ